MTSAEILSASIRATEGEEHRKHCHHTRPILVAQSNRIRHSAHRLDKQPRMKQNDWMRAASHSVDSERDERAALRQAERSKRAPSFTHLAHAFRCSMHAMSSCDVGGHSFFACFVALTQ